MVTTRTSCSVISEQAVGVMICQPWKYPRKLDRKVTKNTAGARAMME